MNNLSINLNLFKFDKAAVVPLKGKSGETKQCLVIPIEDNDLYLGERGVYANFIGLSSDKLNNGKTHIIKRSFSREKQQSMSDEEFNSQPIFGDIRPIIPQAQNDEGWAPPAVDANGEPYKNDLPF
ncbi:hypothetical protein [Gabonia massiliensis]|uniref:hypothetical protein n=1 Tax=Gabonia massiliensis TaxID=1686296 RepID=UPI0006D7A5EB|nr:hypothetical protein [Gabonia massiliensis]